MSCRFRMHIGKCFLAMSSIISAVTASPDSSAEVYSEGTPATNPCERCSRMGRIRPSSSKRGSAFAVSYPQMSTAQRTAARTHLQLRLEVCLERLVHHAGLLPGRDIRHPVLQEHAPPLDEVRHARPGHLQRRVSAPHTRARPGPPTL